MKFKKTISYRVRKEYGDNWDYRTWVFQTDEEEAPRLEKVWGLAVDLVSALAHLGGYNNYNVVGVRIEKLAGEPEPETKDRAGDVRLDEVGAKLDKADLWLREMTSKLTAYAVDEATGRAPKNSKASSLVEELLIYAEQAQEDVKAARALVDEACGKETGRA